MMEDTYNPGTAGIANLPAGTAGLGIGSAGVRARSALSGRRRRTLAFFRCWIRFLFFGGRRRRRLVLGRRLVAAVVTFVRGRTAGTLARRRRFVPSRTLAWRGRLAAPRTLAWGRRRFVSAARTLAWRRGRIPSGTLARRRRLVASRTFTGRRRRRWTITSATTVARGRRWRTTAFGSLVRDLDGDPAAGRIRRAGITTFTRRRGRRTLTRRTLAAVASRGGGGTGDDGCDGGGAQLHRGFWWLCGSALAGTVGVGFLVSGGNCLKMKEETGTPFDGRRRRGVFIDVVLDGLGYLNGMKMWSSVSPSHCNV